MPPLAAWASTVPSEQGALSIRAPWHESRRLVRSSVVRWLARWLDMRYRYHLHVCLHLLIVASTIVEHRAISPVE